MSAVRGVLIGTPLGLIVSALMWRFVWERPGQHECHLTMPGPGEYVEIRQKFFGGYKAVTKPVKRPRSSTGGSR